jgi:hypothetical protein
MKRRRKITAILPKGMINGCVFAPICPIFTKVHNMKRLQEGF